MAESQCRTVLPFAIFWLKVDIIGKFGSISSPYKLLKSVKSTPSAQDSWLRTFLMSQSIWLMA